MTLLLLPGCSSSAPRDAGFGDVSALVSERTGRRVHWEQGTDADREAAEATDTLLADELTVDAAVQARC